MSKINRLEQILKKLLRFRCENCNLFMQSPHKVISWDVIKRAKQSMLGSESNTTSLSDKVDWVDFYVSTIHFSPSSSA